MKKKCEARPRRSMMEDMDIETMSIGVAIEAYRLLSEKAIQQWQECSHKNWSYPYIEVAQSLNAVVLSFGIAAELSTHSSERVAVRRNLCLNPKKAEAIIAEKEFLKLFYKARSKILARKKEKELKRMYLLGTSENKAIAFAFKAIA